MPVLSIEKSVVSSPVYRPRDGGEVAERPTRRAVKPPRLAVMIVPADAREARAGLRRRLRARHGIDQFQYVTLTPAQWDAITDGRTDVPGVERLRGRLATAMLGRANLIAVVGCGVAGSSNDQRTPRSWSDVKRLADRIRSWDVPVPVVGIWTDDEGVAGPGAGAPGHTPVECERHGCGGWLAIRRWEDDGGGW